MASGSAIRGSRVGAGPLGESERGVSVPKIRISYWCADGHESKVAFATDVEAYPDLWDCPKCGLPSGRDKENPPRPPKNEPYKTHLAYVKERRSDLEGAAILHESLDKLREALGG
ncbi:MAG: hypothetical protein RIS43_1121 [Actinomycetota bacterium]|jgi:rubredoxin